jgi:alpha-L-fucosidase
MKILIFPALWSVILGLSCISHDKTPPVMPTPQQVEWSNAEIGVIIHLDINIYAPETFRYNDKNTLPSLSVFNPSRLNTDQWLESAVSAGAKYAVLTAKHGTGFCLWPTKVHDYHAGNTPVRGGGADIVGDFIRSCKKFGVKPGIYYNTNFNTYFGAGYLEMSEYERKQYNDAVYRQLRELWTEYGELFEIWFDGGVMTDEKGGIASAVTELIHTHQPQAILFQGPSSCNNLIRWVGNEDGRAPYPHWSTTDFTTSSSGVEEIIGLNGNPDGKIWCPGEADFPNRKKSAWNGGWLWRAGQEHFIFTADELTDRYYTSVGHNANMLIGMVIDTAGVFPEADAAVFREFGKRINGIFDKPLASVSGNGETLTLKISKNNTGFDHIVLQEDIAKGERIREYRIEGLIGGKWVVLCDGQSVGYKRIHKIPVNQAGKVRLTVTQSVARPMIRQFSVYSSL